jgi:hypothetical protein
MSPGGGIPIPKTSDVNPTLTPNGEPSAALCVWDLRTNDAVCWTMAYFDIVVASASALLVNRPHCLRCGSPMTLVSLTPLVPHMAQRKFECQTCERRKDFNVEREAAAVRKRA